MINHQKYKKDSNIVMKNDEYPHVPCKTCIKTLINSPAVRDVPVWQPKSHKDGPSKAMQTPNVQNAKQVPTTSSLFFQKIPPKWPGSNSIFAENRRFLNWLSAAIAYYYCCFIVNVKYMNFK
uniref:Uncharacterized protein n=1 Tax=Romanomermis culicivorax TaxID=13658 RepID=A0A915HFN4_ROMCU